MRDAVRMLRALFSGRYKGKPWTSLAMFGVLVVYVISPVDLIPDYIPFVGVVDDLAMLALFLRGLRKDVQKFRRWEEERGSGPVP